MATPFVVLDKGALPVKVKRDQLLGCGKTALGGWPGAEVTRNSR
jgi:hypothetical protein